MAGITQTIPNYIGGMSEQPDQLKYPGQVISTLNAIPDNVSGLYKRPGAKRVGGLPLTNVQSGGSWFHYYRDETEGSYIGQVAADGKIRMWCTKDLFNASGTKVNDAGDEIFVHYDAISGSYSQSNYNSSNSDHTAITNYLSATNTEDVQACTVNDTTFLNNRDTVVQTTGTTTARPDAHYAFIDLIRTENGRQYGLNMYTDETTSTLNRATKVQVIDDDLAEGGGTGACKGIGTQVFNVTAASSYSGTDTISVKNSSGSSYTSGRDNLVFRITINGQQGQKSSGGHGYGDSASGVDFQCSYRREITLLHGGEGWVTGDEVEVQMNSTGGGAQDTTYNSSGYTYQRNDGKPIYKVKVLNHEAVQVKGKFNGTAGQGVLRPDPTPFDADTAVTPDTILGGIQGALPTGVTSTVIGNGIYITDANDFNLEVVDLDLMRVMQSEINDVGKLPLQCKDGYIVKISNAENSDEDDYYVRFEGEGGKDGPGTWVECAAPGIVKSFNASTMPHVLQRQTISGTNPVIFLVKKFEWADRKVGDDVTNKGPSFIGTKNSADPPVYSQDVKINKVAFFRNRLVFLAGESVIASRPGTIAKPDFWSYTALAVSATDPIDIDCASTFPSNLFDAIELTTGLLCFSSNEQYLLSADEAILNPDTAKLRSVSTFNYNTVIPPLDLGLSVGWVDNSNKYSRFVESVNIVREGEPQIQEVSKVVPTLLEKNIDLLTNSRENGLVLFGKTNSDMVIGYKYFNAGDKRAQSSWFKFKHNNPIKYHFLIEDQYFFLDTDNFLQSINISQADSDPSIDQDSVNYLIHLDNYVTLTGGVYSATTKKTTFTNGTGGAVLNWIASVTSPNGDLALVDIDSNSVRVGRYAKPTVLTPVSGNQVIEVVGNWSSGIFYIGYLYDYEVKFPRFYAIKTQGENVRSDVNASLVIHRMKLNFGKVGLYETTLTRVGKPDYTEVYESTDLDEYQVSDAPYLSEKIKTIPIYERNTNVNVTLKSSHPAPATLHSMSWEGDYSPRNYRRV